MRNKFLIFSALVVLFAANVFGQIGGNFTITESVIAGGGGQNTAGGAFSLDHTIGQSIAGNSLSGSPFAVTSGFWNFTPLAPSAAQVTISGRVRTADGSGIRNVTVSLTMPNGETRFAATATFGYYRFDNIPAGGTCILGVAAKKFTFSQPTIVRTIHEDISDLDFVADPF